MPNNEIVSIFSAHHRDIVYYARGIVHDAGRAEDIVQDAFIRFQAAMKDGHKENPVGYLYRIVRNLALDFQRRAAYESQLFSKNVDDIADQIAEDKTSLEVEAEACEELQSLLVALDELPERTRIALEMHRLGGYKLKEIAEHFGISKSMAQLLVVEGVKHCQMRLSR